MTPRLYHYSGEPFVLDPDRRYRQDGPEAVPFKPRGLWLSVEADADEQGDFFGWREWCERESFHLDALRFRTELALRPGVNILWIETPAALVAFSRRYERHVHGLSFLRPMDWAAVARDYQGLVIAPYLWCLRLDPDVTWYYAWDCASACIWDCSTLSVG